MNEPDVMYYPCIEDPSTGRIMKRVSYRQMTRDEALEILKTNYWVQWLRCEAIPQPVSLFRGKASES